MGTGRRYAEPSLPENRVLLAFALGTVLAGANAVAVRFTVAELPPFWGAGLRFGSAALILWLVAIVRRTALPPRHVVPGLMLYGAFAFGGAFAFAYWGLKTVEAGLAQVLLALAPLFTFFFAFLHRLEPFRGRGLVGAVIATAGIALSFFEHPAGMGSALPMLAIIAGAACIAESVVLLKLLPAIDPVMTNAVGMSTGGGGLLMLSLLAGEAWSLPTRTATWLSIAYLVLIGSVVVFGMFVFVIRRWKATAASYQLVLMPFVTVALGSWLRGEQVNPGLILGGALVLLGVWVGALFHPSPSALPATAVSAEGDAD